MTTLADISKDTGLAVGTVSEILRNKPGYNANTRQRVLEAVRRLDYRPDPIGRALKGGRTQTFGVLMGSLRTSINLFKLEAIEQIGRKHGYVCYVSHATPDDPKATSAGLRGLLARRIDGLIVYLVAEPSSEILQQLEAAPVPVVYLDWSPPAARFHVAIHREVAMREAAAHLAALGHRRACFLPTPSDVRNPLLKMEPYRQAMAQAGIEMQALTDLVLDPERGMVHSAHERTQTLIHTRRLSEVLLMPNDETALAALAALQDTGLNVPGDVSVIGFDDLVPATYYRPALTTIHQPREQTGAAAIELLLAAMNKQEPEHPHVSFDCHLVPRQSTGPVQPHLAQRLATVSHASGQAPSRPPACD